MSLNKIKWPNNLKEGAKVAANFLNPYLWWVN